MILYLNHDKYCHVQKVDIQNINFFYIKARYCLTEITLFVIVIFNPIFYICVVNYL